LDECRKVRETGAERQDANGGFVGKSSSLGPTASALSLTKILNLAAFLPQPGIFPECFRSIEVLLSFKIDLPLEGIRRLL
jgi:hypothetical protein